MVGVAENDLSAENFEHVLGNGFDGAGGAYGHEDGGFDRLVGEDELGAATAGLGLVEEIELERHSSILVGQERERFVVSRPCDGKKSQGRGAGDLLRGGVVSQV
jgi:hypothetical protein